MGHKERVFQRDFASTRKAKPSIKRIKAKGADVLPLLTAGSCCNTLDINVNAWLKWIMKRKDMNVRQKLKNEIASAPRVMSRSENISAKISQTSFICLKRARPVAENVSKKSDTQRSQQSGHEAERTPMTKIKTKLFSLIKQKPVSVLKKRTWTSIKKTQRRSSV